MMSSIRRADPLIAFVPLALAFGSLVLVYSASSILGITTYNDPYYFLTRRAIHLAIGLLAFFVCARFDYHRLVEKSAGRAYILVLALLAALSVLQHGHVAGGARRWVNIMGATFPRLLRMSLAGWPPNVGLLAALGASPMLATLRELVLSKCGLDDGDLAYVEAHAQRFARLEVLDLRGNAFSRTLVKATKKRLPLLRAAGR